jgi:hypothetical protein
MGLSKRGKRVSTKRKGKRGSTATRRGKRSLTKRGKRSLSKRGKSKRSKRSSKGLRRK